MKTIQLVTPALVLLLATSTVACGGGADPLFTLETKAPASAPDAGSATTDPIPDPKPSPEASPIEGDAGTDADASPVVSPDAGPTFTTFSCTGTGTGTGLNGTYSPGGSGPQPFNLSWAFSFDGTQVCASITGPGADGGTETIQNCVAGNNPECSVPLSGYASPAPPANQVPPTWTVMYQPGVDGGPADINFGTPDDGSYTVTCSH